MPDYQLPVAIYKRLLKLPKARLAIRTKVYVGTIIEKNDRILVVHEGNPPYPGWGWPGGHLLFGEDLASCAIREVREESGYQVTLQGLVGIYQREVIGHEDDYLRIVFFGTAVGRKKKILDQQVEEVSWKRAAELTSQQFHFRKPHLKTELNDYLSDQKAPLSFFKLYRW